MLLKKSTQNRLNSLILDLINHKTFGIKHRLSLRSIRMAVTKKKKQKTNKQKKKTKNKK